MSFPGVTGGRKPEGGLGRGTWEWIPGRTTIGSVSPLSRLTLSVSSRGESIPFPLSSFPDPCDSDPGPSLSPVKGPGPFCEGYSDRGEVEMSILST